MLRIEHLTKKYSDKTAVDDLNLHIQQGEIYGFIGHNGAGKTTTLKSVVGILQFDQAGWYCTVAGYDYVVWSYINGYHDSTFDFFGWEKSVDCTAFCSQPNIQCQTSHGIYYYKNSYIEHISQCIARQHHISNKQKCCISESAKHCYHHRSTLLDRCKLIGPGKHWLYHAHK